MSQSLFRSLCLLAGLLLFTGACTKRESPAEAGLRTQTLIIGNGAEPADLDPQTVTAFTDMNIMVALFEGLTVLDEASSAPLPGVAESWQHSPDALTWTFHLRPNASWSDGSPLVAEDFVFSFRRILSPKLAAEYAYMLWPLKNAQAISEGQNPDANSLGARAIDTHTLELTLEAPCPWLLTLVSNQAWFPVHRPTLERFGAWDERGTRWTRPENLVCNGPFRLSEWAPQSRLVVEANPKYWDKNRSPLRRIIFLPNESLATDERNFRSGQIHATYDLSPEKIETYRREAPERLHIDPFYETFFLRVNVDKPPFNDVRVRRALALTIDRAALCRSVLHDSRTPALSFTPPGGDAYVSSFTLHEDREEARHLLAEAGYPAGKDFPRFEVELKGDDIHRAVMEAIQQMWKKELGIDCSLAPLEQMTWLANQKAISYQLSTSRWIGDYLDANTFLDLFLSSGGKNQTHWTSPDYDKLVSEAAACSDKAQRQSLQQKAEQLLLTELPIIPIFHGTRVYLLHPGVKNWPPSLLGLRRYQYVKLQRD